MDINQDNEEQIQPITANVKIREPQKVRIIKKHDIKRIYNNPQPEIKPPIIKKPEKQFNIKDMTIENLLDINFYERCFFGKNFPIKDQLIFRVYARELLDMIKSNLNQ